jgi:hypothetical protein
LRERKGAISSLVSWAPKPKEILQNAKKLIAAEVHKILSNVMFARQPSVFAHQPQSLPVDSQYESLPVSHVPLVVGMYLWTKANEEYSHCIACTGANLTT